MIVYREQRRRVRTADVLRRIDSTSGFERQMNMGELEAGVADELCPECDADLPVLRELRAGRWQGLPLPIEITVSVPEGFAYYALDPELYRIAARRFVNDLRPPRVAVIGLRTIGTTLGTVVETEIRRAGVETESWTVRPRSHPWERTIKIAPELARRWSEWEGYFAIVDEGPGMSGSSFAAICRLLAGLGIEAERVVLLPGWCPEGREFANPQAAEIWRAHRKYWASFEELGLFEGDIDFSGGKWRDRVDASRGVSTPHTRVPAAREIAVQPQHERRKYLRGSRLFRFAGYGRYGREKLERAGALQGFIPGAAGLERGFLESEWVNGGPANCDSEFIDFAARYLAYVRQEFDTGESANCGPLADLIAENTGFEWPDRLPDGPAVLLDARMLPHEWIATVPGWVKADALDHFDDHFYPGPQDIAWDLAAFSFEFDLSPDAERRFLDRYAREAGEECDAERLRFHRAAYIAFRLGYCDMASAALGDSADGVRFAHERERYSSAIRSESWTTTRSRSFA